MLPQGVRVGRGMRLLNLLTSVSLSAGSIRPDSQGHSAIHLAGPHVFPTGCAPIRQHNYVTALTPPRCALAVPAPSPYLGSSRSCYEPDAAIINYYQEGKTEVFAFQ